MEWIVGLVVGVAMGALLQRAGASNPRMIAQNLRLENLTIIKFMALAIAVGSVGSYLLHLFLPMHFAIKPLYVLGVLGGGLLFGVGFAVAGYCPGTCVVGAAEGRKDAWFTVAGGLLGALVFTLMYPALEATLIRPWNVGKVTMADWLHLPPLLVALLLASVLITVVWRLPTVPQPKK